MMSVNMRHPILGTGINTPLGLKDPNMAAKAAQYVRNAISYVIPRMEIINNIMGGLAFPATTLWTQGMNYYERIM